MNRSGYSEYEDVRMLKWVARKNDSEAPLGITLWRSYAEHYGSDHSPQSLNGRMRRQVIPNILNYVQFLKFSDLRELYILFGERIGAEKKKSLRAYILKMKETRKEPESEPSSVVEPSRSDRRDSSRVSMFRGEEPPDDMDEEVPPLSTYSHKPIGESREGSDGPSTSTTKRKTFVRPKEYDDLLCAMSSPKVIGEVSSTACLPSDEDDEEEMEIERIQMKKKQKQQIPREEEEEEEEMMEITMQNVIGVVSSTHNEPTPSGRQTNSSLQSPDTYISTKKTSVASEGDFGMFLSPKGQKKKVFEEEEEEETNEMHAMTSSRKHQKSETGSPKKSYSRIHPKDNEEDDTYSEKPIAIKKTVLEEEVPDDDDYVSRQTSPKKVKVPVPEEEEVPDDDYYISPMASPPAKKTSAKKANIPIREEEVPDDDDDYVSPAMSPIKKTPSKKPKAPPPVEEEEEEVPDDDDYVSPSPPTKLHQKAASSEDDDDDYVTPEPVSVKKSSPMKQNIPAIPAPLPAPENLDEEVPDDDDYVSPVESPVHNKKKASISYFGVEDDDDDEVYVKQPKMRVQQRSEFSDDDYSPPGTPTSYSLSKPLKYTAGRSTEVTTTSSKYKKTSETEEVKKKVSPKKSPQKTPLKEDDSSDEEESEMDKTLRMFGEEPLSKKRKKNKKKKSLTPRAPVEDEDDDLAARILATVQEREKEKAEESGEIEQEEEPEEEEDEDRQQRAEGGTDDDYLLASGPLIRVEEERKDEEEVVEAVDDYNGSRSPSPRHHHESISEVPPKDDRPNYHWMVDKRGHRRWMRKPKWMIRKDAGDEAGAQEELKKFKNIQRSVSQTKKVKRKWYTFGRKKVKPGRGKSKLVSEDTEEEEEDDDDEDADVPDDSDEEPQSEEEEHEEPDRQESEEEPEDEEDEEDLKVRRKWSGSKKRGKKKRKERRERGEHEDDEEVEYFGDSMGRRRPKVTKRHRKQYTKKSRVEEPVAVRLPSPPQPSTSTAIVYSPPVQPPPPKKQRTESTSPVVLPQAIPLVQKRGRGRPPKKKCPDTFLELQAGTSIGIPPIELRTSMASTATNGDNHDDDRVFDFQSWNVDMRPVAEQAVKSMYESMHRHLEMRSSSQEELSDVVATDNIQQLLDKMFKEDEQQGHEEFVIVGVETFQNRKLRLKYFVKIQEETAKHTRIPHVRSAVLTFFQYFEYTVAATVTGKNFETYTVLMDQLIDVALTIATF
ncbi:unnamed protein product [Caenorhabditis sp. 36 PRJEB53466]|nr:unnamed protein product [Caenorhabditis sp. 36 PRJEB53466]